MSLNCFLIVSQWLSIITLINAVPIIVDDIGSNNLTSIPDPVNINGSLTVLDATVPTTDSTTLSSNLSTANESRDGRSDEGLIISNQESIKNESSPIIRLQREDDLENINSTSPKSLFDEIATNSSVSEVSMESNSTEGLIELSSSSSSSSSSESSAVIDLASSTTAKPSTNDEQIGVSTSSITPRIGRSQSDTIEDEINSDLNDTLLVLTTLSSILNQSITNDSLSTV